MLLKGAVSWIVSKNLESKEDLFTHGKRKSMATFSSKRLFLLTERILKCFWLRVAKMKLFLAELENVVLMNSRSNLRMNKSLKIDLVNLWSKYSG